MATTKSSPGRGWSLPGFSAGRPGRVASPSQIRVFSAKGIAGPGTLGTSPLPQIGVPIPGTNLVYVRPRLTQDALGGAGGSQFPYAFYRYPGQVQIYDNKPGLKLTPAVHYTNPEMAFYRERRRTPSIGAGRALQQGLTMAVPYESDAPFFSVA